MTVCAAALCRMPNPAGQEEEIVLGISDRMITSGDIEYEAHQTKIYVMSPTKIVCLGSGDSDALFGIVTETHQTIIERGTASISQAARLYSQNFACFRQRSAEQVHLVPIGLDMATFLSQQRKLQPALALDLAERLHQAELGIETIIAGADSSGAHIYSVGGPPGLETCQEIRRDGGGFWAIGSGARQFETLFMASGYSRFWSWVDALLLMYMAKKRAEISPGVGRATDVFFIDSGEGIKKFRASTIETLEGYYAEFEEAVRTKRNDIMGRMSSDPRLVQTEISFESQSEVKSEKSSV